MFIRTVVVLFALSFAGCLESAESAVPRLMKELQSKDPHTRATAARSLASYGEDGAKAVPLLIKALNDSNGGVKSAASFALRKINTKEAVSALEKAEKQQWGK